MWRAILGSASILYVCSGTVEQTEAGVKVAWAVEGGGFRAQAAPAGLVAGMLAYVGQKESVATTLEATGLLDRFDILSSNSGGSWFAASLAYSRQYLGMVEGMAASPSTAAAQHHAKWTLPFLTATKVNSSDFDLMEELAHRFAGKILSRGDADTLFLTQFFLATGFTWNDWTKTLLESTAFIDSTTTLGSPVNKWAADKSWFAAHSVLLPSKNNEAFLHGSKMLHYPTCYYYAEGSLPEVLPATFSIKLGAGVNSSATTSYIPSTIAKKLTNLQYSATIVPFYDLHATTQAWNLDRTDFNDGVLTVGAGSLPVISVAASSSAVGGIAPTLGVLVDEALILTDGDLTLYVTNAPNGAAFHWGTEIYESLSVHVDQSAVESLAASKFHGLIDGGYTDNTALAQAVAGGADEVTLVLNSNSTGTPTSIPLLFKDGPPPVEPGTSGIIFPVFESRVDPTMDAEFSKFTKLYLPSSTCLKMFSVGTIDAITADNEFWGITGGRSVKINVVNIGGDLTIGFFEGIRKYDSFAQEIIQAILAKENDAIVQSHLLQFFKGAARNPLVTLV